MFRDVVAGLAISSRKSEGGQYGDGIAAAVKGDSITAHELLNPLAECGDPFAQDDVGVMYAKGYGVAQDAVTAAKWFARAAGQGHPCAQFHLGLCYQDGLGVPQDYVLAHVWFNLAAACEPDPGLRVLFADSRNQVEKRLSHDQITEAQRIARAWKPTPEQ